MLDSNNLNGYWNNGISRTGEINTTMLTSFYWTSLAKQFPGKECTGTNDLRILVHSAAKRVVIVSNDHKYNR